METDNANPEAGPDVHDEDRSSVSCNSCRKRKARCSREFPTCLPCQKIGVECEYKVAKAKPGMKPGTIEAMQRRLGRLEAAFEQQGIVPAAATDAPSTGVNLQATSSTNNDLHSLVALFVKELRNVRQDPTAAASEYLSAPAATSRERNAPNHAHVRDDQDDYDQRQSRSPKRRRFGDGLDDGHGGGDPAAGFSSQPFQGVLRPLPTGSTLTAMIRTYFTHIHPWIPMIQEHRFRNRLSDPQERPKLDLMLYAMFVSTACHSELTIPRHEVEQVRNWIVSEGIGGFSVEALQALTIIAFTDIGNGQGSKAWSIVGALTRTAEYLQLTTEQDHHHRRPLLSPAESLSVLPAKGAWIESEERRRVFWNIFNLDRFCSVSMGWNTSLTSDDVHRRLPCDVELWQREEKEHHDEIITPYFNIWDRSATRIGNTITFIPSHMSLHDSPHSQGFNGGGGGGLDDEESQSPLDNNSMGRLPEANKWSSTTTSMVGAFAYNVEATESLSRVTTHFLQQKVDLRNPREMNSWLTRFKELDLRLIHWKMLLPQKWKPNMATTQSVKMDPNLTVAHVTHNASILLLHQPIAFISTALHTHPSFSAQLPSASSAETCRAAAVEIALIAKNYIKTSSGTLPLSNQFAFCVYVAARSLLVHWRYYMTPEVAPEYTSLLDSLERMADRWCGGPGASAHMDSLAASYARKLTEMHQRCVESDLFRIDPLEYTNDISHHPRKAPRVNVEEMAPRQRFDQGSQDGLQVSQEALNDVQQPTVRHGPSYGNHDYSSGSGIGGQDAQGGVPQVNMVAAVAAVPEIHGPEDLAGILTDHQFLDMDRVISLQDGMFDVDYEGQGWE